MTNTMEKTNNTTAQATTTEEKTTKILDIETSFEPFEPEDEMEKTFNLFSLKNVIRMIAFTLVGLALLLTTLFSYNAFIQHNGETTVLIQLAGNEHYSHEPSFSSCRFTPALIKAIKEKKIDLYGVQFGETIHKNSTDQNEVSAYFVETEDAVKGTAAHLKFVGWEETNTKNYNGNPIHCWVIDYVE